MSQRYQQSELLLARAEQSIPLGSQTFSKSKIQFPFGVSPYFIEHGEGCHVWDADGNEYIDFTNGLLSVTLGYNDTDVNAAVEAQLRNGVTFSLPHRLEIEVAEKLIQMVPCAEMVRFAKNGSDATTGAIRLARAVTGREHVAVCGYHGWQDWYIGTTTRNRGVPEATTQLSHTFSYNNIDSLTKLFESYPGQIAAVILEPMSATYPEPGFLQAVKELTHTYGAILVFDETITGFRFANGGAQEYFSVIPDLATFGKGMANGFPLSAVVGRKDIMRVMEDIFFSSTFGGETLSLAAANAVLNKYLSKPVVQHLYSQGEKVLTGARELIEKHNVVTIVNLAGSAPWSLLSIQDAEPYSSWDIKTLFMQEMLARGILTIGSHNMSYSHSDADIETLLKAYDEVLPIISQAVKEKKLRDLLRAEPLQPLFRVR